MATSSESEPLWRPTKLGETRMDAFRAGVNEKFGLNLGKTFPQYLYRGGSVELETPWNLIEGILTRLIILVLVFRY